MKHLIKRKELIVYCSLAVLFILLALLGKWDSPATSALFSAPFACAGNAIRSIGAKSTLLAYIIYICIGIAPLIFPTVRAVKTKKLLIRDISWLILSIFLFIILYYFINPHKIQFILFRAGFSDTVKEQARKITLLGFSITAFAILLLALLCEFYAKLKKSENKAYLYSKILFSVLIAGVIFNLLFVEFVAVKTTIAAIPDDIDLINSININRPTNIFVIVITYLIKFAPACFTILLFLQAKDFIGNLQVDAFSKSNIPKLNAIIKYCILTIFVSLSATVVENVIYLLLSDVLLNAYYNVSVPVGMVLIACLILIFSKILIKSIEINEENKLVI